MIIMKKIIIIFLIFLIFIQTAAAGNVTIKGVDFEIPDQYEHGTLKDSSYVYQSGFKFRILALDSYKNLKFNYGSDISESNSHTQTNIAGHDAVIIPGEYNSVPHTTVYFVTGDIIYLICFNDTYVNDDITEMISKTPAQNMSTDDFYATLDYASGDYQKQVDDENAEYDAYQQSRQNRPVNRYFFFSF